MKVKRGEKVFGVINKEKPCANFSGLFRKSAVKYSLQTNFVLNKQTNILFSTF